MTPSPPARIALPPPTNLAPSDGMIRRAIVRGVHDGDTILVDVDCGLHVGAFGVAIRMAEVSAKEIHGSEAADGLRAKAHLESVLATGSEVVLQIENTVTHQAVYSLGRVVARVWYLGRNVCGEHALWCKSNGCWGGE